MKQTEKADLLLKHYRNIRGLSLQQLVAIKEEKLSVVTDLIAQKEILINEIRKWHDQNEISDCMPDVASVLHEFVREINDYEEQGQNLLTERQEQVRKAMFVNQKSKIIQQAYESQSFPHELNIQK